MSTPRSARVRALAKVNLSLRVLGTREDGYHEIRTIFQTISLSDSLDLEFSPARRTSIELVSVPEIPGNLVERAARLVLDAMRATGRLCMRLDKQIPMGSGLGGGSSDAAAVLLALPVLAGKRLEPGLLLDLAGQLGSDVSFFLLGGTALGIGRGTEVYPLRDFHAGPGLVVAPDVHVSTAEAYRALDRGLTSTPESHTINVFQSLAWTWREGPPFGKHSFHQNDFEKVVFEQHPSLKSLKRKLAKLGASPAMLTGSGAALFGFFKSARAAAGALLALDAQRSFPARLVSRNAYRSLWWRCLRTHMDQKTWPPQSRYAQ